jgi:uncharacterized protein (TIGR00730 family)
MRPIHQLTVTIFGSSTPVEGEERYTEATHLGRLLARSGYAVCNGGFGGTMEATARGAKEAGGKTTGVITGAFGAKANPFIDRTIVMPGLIDRLMKLIELGDAYVVLRGGTGTLLELAAVWEITNKKISTPRPIVVLGSLWEGVIDLVESELIAEMAPGASRHILRATSPEECITLLDGAFGPF